MRFAGGAEEDLASDDDEIELEEDDESAENDTLRLRFAIGALAICCSESLSLSEPLLLLLLLEEDDDDDVDEEDMLCLGN